MRLGLENLSVGSPFGITRNAENKIIEGVLDYRNQSQE